MKSYIYTDEEVAALREGGAILGRILGELVDMVKPGMTTGELDAHAERRMREAGGEPSFKGYKAGGSVPFPGTVCTSINDEVVHAPPVPSRPVKEGDIISLDIGLRYKGLCTDMAVTVPVGSVSKEALRLMRITKDSLFEGIEGIKPGALIRDIGRNVQKVVEAEGFSVVRDLVGHGVGHHVHEGPSIPNFDDETMPKVVIKKGMVLAVEPMVNAGGYDVQLHPNAWTIMTADKTLSAHFEVTLAVTDDGHEVLTPLPRVPGL